MAMFQTKSKEIDGIEFKVTQFTATEAYGIKRKLTGIVAPLILSLLGNDTKKILDADIDMTKLSSAVQNAFESLPENEFVGLLKRLTKNVEAHTTLNEKPVVLQLSDENHFDLCFTGKTFTIYPLLIFVLEVNFPDFFGKVKGGIGQNFQTIISNTLNKSANNPLTGSEKLES